MYREGNIFHLSSADFQDEAPRLNHSLHGLRFVKKIYSSLVQLIPLRFRKAGRMWWGGAQKTHCAMCHNGVTPSKTKEFLYLLF